METMRYDSRNASAWDAMILASRNYTFFHCMGWAKAIAATYGNRCLFVATRDGDDFAAVPLVVKRGPLSGPRGVCLPFSDFCGPVYTDRRVLDGLTGHLQSMARSRKWKGLEIRTDCRMPGFAPGERYFEHVLSLRRTEEDLFRSFRPSTRRNIQRAIQAGVKVEISRDPRALDSFYRLHCLTRKRLGVPPQPKLFFRNVLRFVIEPGDGFVARCRYRDTTVAAAVFLHFGSAAVYKFGASLPDRERLRPNNLLMWEAIRWYMARGYRSLSLGRTDPEDEGLMQFKNGWGAVCREVRYSRWPPVHRGGRGVETRLSRIVSPILKFMPVSALRCVGTIGYRLL